MELTCRSQAKDIAVQTYQSCITTARKQRVDEIRKEYQEKLTELKSHYDSELKKLAPNSSTTSNPNSSATSNSTALPAKNTTKVSAKSKKSRGHNRESSGIAQTLPQKKFQNVQTLPVQSVSEMPMNKSSDENESESASSYSDNGDDINVVVPGSISE